MANFIVSIRITIDKIKTQTGHIGCVSGSENYSGGRVKEAIANQYKIHYPHAKQIDIEFTEIKKVSPEEYDAMSKTLTEMGRM